MAEQNLEEPETREVPFSANDTADLPRATVQPHPSSRQMKKWRVEDGRMLETDRPAMRSGWTTTVTI
jgi:hypothetical protein